MSNNKILVWSCIPDSLWLFNIAIENGTFIVDLPI